MIQIFLDDRPVQIASGTSLKLTLENPLYLTGSSYTYEVELPMSIAENRDFFGPLGRIDTRKKKKTYSARLLVDNRTMLAGRAVLIQVTDTVAKVQLLSSIAAAAYSNRSTELYVDELDVETPSAGDPAWFEAYPVYNSTAGFICNYIGLEYRDGAFSATLGSHSPDTEVEFLGMGIVTPQPYLWAMARKVAAACGYDLPNADNILYTDPFLKELFIANASGSPKIRYALPHWTVTDWWNEIRKAFGAVLEIGSDGKTARLVSVDTHYAGEQNLIELTKILDEYQVDLDDDSQADVTTSNTGFADFDSDPVSLLEDDIIDLAKYDDSYSSEDELITALSMVMDLDGWAEEHRNTIFRIGGRQYIIFRERYSYPCLLEVNQLRPRIVNEDSSEVEAEIRFVPCKLENVEVQVRRPLPFGFNPGATTDDIILGSSEPLMLSRPDRADARELSNPYITGYYSLEGIIDNTEEAPEKGEPEDVVYIAMRSGATEAFPIKLKDGVHLSPPPLLYANYKVPGECVSSARIDLSTLTFLPGSDVSMGLNEVPGVRNLYSASIARASRINTRVKYCIKFVTDSLPGTGDIFLIRNKRFICEKLEASIMPDGMDNIVTGYFYEFA